MDTARAAETTDTLTETHSSYSVWHRMLEVFGIVAAYTMVSWLTYRFIDVVLHTYDIGETNRGHWLATTLVGSLLVGYLVADLASGLVHWGFDRFGRVDTPLLGSNFVRPFRHHHVDPKEITRHDFIETNGNNCLATVIPLAAFCFLPLDFEHAGILFFVSMITFAAVFTFATNQFHKWAHENEPPAFVTWLQDKHLILPRDHHQIHHTFPYESHYCITTGWMNGFMSRICFWSTAERILHGAFGVHVHRDAAPVERK